MGRGLVRIREGMSPQEVSAAHTQIANLAKKAADERDGKINRLAQQANNGQVPISEVPGRLDVINREYNDVMSRLRDDNDKLARMYGMSQIL